MQFRNYSILWNTKVNNSVHIQNSILSWWNHIHPHTLLRSILILSSYLYLDLFPYISVGIDKVLIMIATAIIIINTIITSSCVLYKNTSTSFCRPFFSRLLEIGQLCSLMNGCPTAEEPSARKDFHRFDTHVLIHVHNLWRPWQNLLRLYCRVLTINHYDLLVGLN